MRRSQTLLIEPTLPVEAQTTTDLRAALRASGLTPIRTTRVITLLPPAGRHWLLEQLRADPQNTFPTIVHAHMDQVAGLLRTTSADARTVQKALRTAVQR